GGDSNPGVAALSRRRRITLASARLVRAIKRAACECKRPKSREETPKEGGGSARRYRTATICHRSAQEASPLLRLITAKSFCRRDKENWAARECRRPKSREETPKEGSGSGKAVPRPSDMTP